MPTITLPDGSTRDYSDAVTVYDVAASIGAGLAKAALAGEVDGQLVDTSYLIESDQPLRIITSKDPEGLEIIRHSTAHLLAQATQQLFPDVQVTIGPVVDDGFYYDFAAKTPFTPDDFEAIEARMHELAKEDLPVTRKEVTRAEAIEFFKELGEHYKVEIVEAIPENEVLTIYTQGGFSDLCRGPHVPRTGLLQAFKLTKLAGAYWRGDSNNEMLQRVYGTAWATPKELKAYLHRLEEAEKRDHRKLAKKMDLFHFQQEAPGMVFWHPNGWSIVQVMRRLMRRVQRESGYQEINTPQLADLSLWEKSGHLAKFDDDMFMTHSENRDYAIKPMNCPCHVQVFKQGLKSYRDLPVRYAEFGSCYRNEPSGALHGLMRLRGFTQDDGHVFCTEQQIHGEVLAFIDQLFPTYRSLGFDQIEVRISTRPEKRVGSDEVWDKAEGALAAALDEREIPWQELPGEGAFYGPKIEFSLRDSIGRVWQCGTMQVDFSMPERLGAEYVDEHSERRHPVMLHRAMLGSLERFIGILLEEYAEGLPLWMAPIQVAVLNITDRTADYSREIAEKLKKRGIRVKLDLRNEKIGFKIREHTIARVPYLLVLGDREAESATVAVRARDGSQDTLEADAFVAKLLAELDEYGL